jgi:hypothetical protein
VTVLGMKLENYYEMGGLHIANGKIEEGCPD